MSSHNTQSEKSFQDCLAFGKHYESLAAPFLKEYADSHDMVLITDGRAFRPDFFLWCEDGNKCTLDVKALRSMAELCFEVTKADGTTPSWAEFDDFDLFYLVKYDAWHLVNTRKLRSLPEWAACQAFPNKDRGELCKYFEPSELIQWGCAEDVTAQVKTAWSRAHSAALVVQAV